MIPTQIYLDLDDVCNAFTLHALRAVGCPVNASDFHKFDPAWGFDIIKAANALHPGPAPHKYSPDVFTLFSFWGKIGRDVWRDAPESTEFKWLLQKCEDLVGRENVCILTAPIEDPECLAGKLEWILAHCPKWLHRQYLMGPQKYLLAQPGALLIDDSDKNVDEFEACGGEVLLVPRPWNSLHRVDTRRHLSDAFHFLFEEKSCMK